MENSSYDAIIIGAGLSGMYQLYRLRKLGLSAHVFETGGDVGGTWYWNRYPGARFDSESWSYGFSFSEEILKEWKWTEHFAAQPETLDYCNYIADKLDLRRDISFGCRVRSAVYEEDRNQWVVGFCDQLTSSSRFLITAVGPISEPIMPTISGIEDFQGEAYHTANWPHQRFDFSNKRVAVVGTGATGVQTITEVAKTVGWMTVFQRSPNWCAPLVNGPITDAEQEQIQANYTNIFERCKTSFGAFVHNAEPQNTLDVSVEEREAFFEKLYNSPGFGIWMGNYRDILVDECANSVITDFMRRKIFQRVNDQKKAEKLVPVDHGFGTRRVPLESGYYEVFNQHNVDLIDLRETPITRITQNGIKTTEMEFSFDIIIYATGFDAIVGSFNRIDIRGTGGRSLKEKWSNGPRTYLGLQVSGFPNLFTLVGPHNAASFCNIPRCIEQNVDWVTALLEYMKSRGNSRIEASLAAEETWTAHVHETAEKLLLTKVDSWMTAINKNIEGRNTRTFLCYAGGAPRYRAKCEQVANAGYEGFRIS